MSMLDRIRCLSRFNSVIKLSIILIFISSTSIAAPVISAVTQSTNALSITITGSNFGAKPIAVPIMFNNNDSEPLGSLPNGYSKAAYTGSQVGVSSTKSHSGTQSVNFDFSGMVYSGTGSGTSRFPRIAADMGAGTNVNDVYFSAWVYMTTPVGDAAGFNWKGPLLSSGTNYYWGSPPQTASGFAGFYEITPVSKWFNSATSTQYSTDGVHSLYSYGSSPGWPSDAFLFDQWQRVEWVWKSSSAPSTADGTITVNRLGHSGNPQLLQATGIITHGPVDNRWRYVSIPQGMTNVDGTLSMQMYFDDMYIDNSLARVELCNTPTWATRTYCEIQPATAWVVDKITVNFNRGGFTDGQKVYVYVVDSNGVVSSDVSPFTIEAVPSKTSATPPLPPKNAQETK
ncbi:MAG: hypothetical protein PHF56_18765 [Desulfuromonadaceae bacterium]|nr:hypothetical protein [Desulfuromonadaceae bacterium]